MNYRHAFHAGNFADVFKHVILVRILLHLLRKDAAFRYVDTHAGVGLYDLDSPEAARTGEWRDGVGRLEEPLEGVAEELLRPYRHVIEATRGRHGPQAYPGSPALARELLRPSDKAVLVEKHPADAARLRERFNSVRNVKALELDGWIALGSLLPPPERRGLVLIDPPYEVGGELRAAARHIGRAARKWPTGVYAWWYPVKDAEAVEEAWRLLLADMGRPCLRLELSVGELDDSRLSACGLGIVNPPWTLQSESELLLPALAQRLSRTGDGSWRALPINGMITAGRR